MTNQAFLGCLPLDWQHALRSLSYQGRRGFPSTSQSEWQTGSSVGPGGGWYPSSKTRKI